MLEESKLVSVTNISGAPAVYQVPELNIRRTFFKGEKKLITVKELRALSYIPGGKSMLLNFLSVDNDELLEEFGYTAEPEYRYTEDDVKDLLLNGSLESLQDCLDYAPQGIVDVLKSLATSLEINDMSKREAIFQATGFNVSKAIELNRADQEESDVKEAAEKPTRQRRVPVAGKTKEAAPKATTDYKIIK